jgi:hypothetical protein
MFFKIVRAATPGTQIPCELLSKRCADAKWYRNPAIPLPLCSSTPFPTPHGCVARAHASDRGPRGHSSPVSFQGCVYRGVIRDPLSVRRAYANLSA